MNSELKKDTRDFNNNRVDRANDENEIWKIVSDLNKPKTNDGIILLENGVKIVKEDEVAEIFNDFFIKKIKKLKDNIDPNYVEDPLSKLKAKFEGRKLNFALRTVTEQKVLQSIQGLKNKKVQAGTR